MTDRKDWDTYFLDMAALVSTRATCPSRMVGAVIVNPETHAVIATGYNGAPKGTPHCTEECLTRDKGTHWDKCRAVHGEMNAICNAAMNGVSTNGATIYLTCTPCEMCARVLINAGILSVVCNDFYANDNGQVGGPAELIRANIQLWVKDRNVFYSPDNRDPDEHINWPSKQDIQPPIYSYQPDDEVIDYFEKAYKPGGVIKCSTGNEIETDVWLRILAHTVSMYNDPKFNKLKDRYLDELKPVHPDDIASYAPIYNYQPYHGAIDYIEKKSEHWWGGIRSKKDKR